MVEAKLKEKSIISYMKEGVKTSDFVETFELINS
jgi:hypothetical protein